MCIGIECEGGRGRGRGRGRGKGEDRFHVHGDGNLCAKEKKEKKNGSPFPSLAGLKSYDIARSHHMESKW